MESKSLLFGISGFILGGLVVAIAATTLNQPVENSTMKNSDMTMSQMTVSLATQKGDDYDKAFIVNMIDHHQSAVDMAKLSETRAKHSEVKKLSSDIVTAQEKEIAQMKQWQIDWGYGSSSADTTHSMP